MAKQSQKHTRAPQCCAKLNALAGVHRERSVSWNCGTVGIIKGLVLVASLVWGREDLFSRIIFQIRLVAGQFLSGSPPLSCQA